MRVLAPLVCVASVALGVGACGEDVSRGPDSTAVRTTTTAARLQAANSTTFPTVNVPAVPTSTTLPPIIVPEDVKPPMQVYTVAAGDTWIRIAQKTQIPLQDILDANKMVISTSLYPGMILQIPPPVGTTPGPTTTVPIVGKYTVVAGDAWGLIAQKLGVQLSDLLRVNKATVETLILPGQQINVPAKRNR
jgi:LysM repeat protein